MALKEEKFFASFGVMGGYMQPQGHLQVISNMIDYGLNPQEALNFLRFCIEGKDQYGTVYLEDGISEEVIEKLKNMGHNVSMNTVKGYDRSMFGRGQIITKDFKTGVLCGGTDPRCDGIVIGY